MFQVAAVAAFAVALLPAPVLAQVEPADARYCRGPPFRRTSRLIVDDGRLRRTPRSALEPKEPRPSGLRRARAPDVDERLDAQTHEHGCQPHHSSL